MQLKSNSSMLSLTKSIDMASTTSTLSIKTNIERTADGRFIVKKANSLDDEFSSEAISSCSDNDEKMCMAVKSQSEKCPNEIEFEDESSGASDCDSMLDNFDVTLVNDSESYSPKNDAERMFFEVVEVLRFEQEVKTYGIIWDCEQRLSTHEAAWEPFCFGSRRKVHWDRNKFANHLILLVCLLFQGQRLQIHEFLYLDKLICQWNVLGRNEILEVADCLLSIEWNVPNLRKIIWRHFMKTNWVAGNIHKLDALFI